MGGIVAQARDSHSREGGEGEQGLFDRKTLLSGGSAATDGFLTTAGPP